jgi:hypothetical protein
MAAAFVVAAIGVWLGPKPKIFGAPGGGGGH